MTSARQKGNALLQEGKLQDADDMYTQGLVDDGDDLQEWKLLMSNRWVIYDSSS